MESALDHVSFRFLKKIVRFLLTLMNRRDKLNFALAIFFISLSTMIGTLSTVLLAKILQGAAFSSMVSHNLTLIVILFVAAKGIVYLLQNVRWLLFNPTAYMLTYKFGAMVALAAARLTMGLQDKRSAEETGRLLGIIDKAEMGIMSISYNVIVGIVPIIIDCAVVILTTLLVIGWQSSLLLALSALIYFGAVSFGKKLEITTLGKAYERDVDVSKHIAQLASNAKLLNEYNASDFFMGNVNHAISDSLPAHNKYFKIKVWRSVVVALGLVLSYGLVALYAYYFENSSGLVAIFLMIAFLDRLITPLGNVSASIARVRSSMQSLLLCSDLRLFDTKPKKEKHPAFVTSIEINHEQVGSHRGQAIHAGETVFIRGTSGSGKSSLLNAIYSASMNADTSAVIVKDIDFRNNVFYAQPCEESWVLYLTGSPIINTGSVRDNILLGDQTISESDFETVWKLVWYGSAQVNITPASPSSQLSAGEQQRVCLARALLRKPAVLILDEATNALDLYSEGVVWKNITTYLNESIILVTAHRFDNFGDCDHELLIEHGEIRKLRPQVEQPLS